MVNCAVYLCKNNNNTCSYTKNGISLHIFPSHPDLKRKWINATKRPKTWFPNRRSCICSKHFTEDCFINEKTRRKLYEYAVPTLFLPVFTIGPGPSESSEPPQKKVRHDAADSKAPNEDVVDRSQTKEPERGAMRVSTNWLSVINVSQESLKKEIIMDLHTLSDKIQKFIPEVGQRQFTLHFKGEDGDETEYIFMSASRYRRLGFRHSNTRCNGCSNAIVGSRYKCVVCADYDLCTSCEALDVHPQHVMLRITKPVKNKQARQMLEDLVNKIKAEGIEDILEEHTDTQQAPGPDSPTFEVPVESKCKGKAKSTQPAEQSADKDIDRKRRKPDGTDETEDSESTSEDETENKEKEKEFEVEIKIEPSDVYDTFSETAELTVSVEAVKNEDSDPLGAVKQEEPVPVDTAASSSGPWPVTIGTVSLGVPTGANGSILVINPCSSAVPPLVSVGRLVGSTLVMTPGTNPPSKATPMSMGPSSSIMASSSNVVQGSPLKAGPKRKVIDLNLPSGTTLPAGATLPPGSTLPQVFTLPQGVNLMPGVKLSAPLNLPPGTSTSAGLGLPPGYVMQQVFVNPPSVQPVTTATTDTSDTNENSFPTDPHCKGS